MICTALPDAYEEPAWVGTRWRVRGRTFAHVVGIVVDEDTDWDEVRELLTESYCLLAPKKLGAQVRAGP